MRTMKKSRNAWRQEHKMKDVRSHQITKKHKSKYKARKLHGYCTNCLQFREFDRDKDGLLFYGQKSLLCTCGYIFSNSRDSLLIKLTTVQKIRSWLYRTKQGFKEAVKNIKEFMAKEKL